MNTCRNDNMPAWAQRIEDHGRKISRHTEKQAKNRNAGYIGNIVFGILFLWIVNNLQSWDPGFLKDNFNVVLWALNLSIIVQIAGNALMLMTSGTRAVRYLSQMVMEAASFLAQIVLYFIYPFDFSHVHGFAWVDWFLPIALIIGMVVSAVKVITNAWKLLFHR